MEKMAPPTQKPNKGPANGLLPALLCAPLTALMPLLALVMPAIWAYAMRRTKPVYVLLYTAVFAGAASFFYNAVGVVGLAGLMALSALTVYVGQTKRIGNAYTALLTGGAAAAMLYVCVCGPGILSGAGAFAAVQAIMDESAALLMETVSAMPDLPAGFTAAYGETLDYMRAYASDAVVPLICAAAGAIGLSNLLFFRLFCGKRAEGLAPMRPFRLWAVPRGMTGGMLIMLIGALVLEMTEWEYGAALAATVNVIVGMPLVLQGLCLIDFWIVRGGGSEGKGVTRRRIFIYLLAGVTLLGCLEQIFQLRRRITEGPKQEPPSFPQY